VEYYEQGLERQRAGDLRGALQGFTRAIQLDPGLVRAYVARSSVYLALGDLNQALRDADVALEIAPSAESYFLRGEVLRLNGQNQQALEAFEQALARDPSLRGETFLARWSVARAAGDADLVSTLSEEYAAAHSDDPLRYYYRAWAALESGMHEEAVAVLAEGIAESGHAPAVLWYLLGRAYTRMSAWPEAVASLETARALVEAGDRSLALHSEYPVAQLFVTLGQAYLGAGRCADAESMVSYGLSIGAPTSEYLPVLREAQLCATPTPGATPSLTKTPHNG
jgi:tetratricopeptide (TPR) repeat protein